MLSSANQRFQPDQPMPSVAAHNRYDGTAAKPVSQLDGAVNAITSEIAQLEVNLSNLISQLNPVLQESDPPAPVCASKGIETGARSPLIDELAIHANRVRLLNEQVSSIQRRLVI